MIKERLDALRRQLDARSSILTTHYVGLVHGGLSLLEQNEPEAAGSYFESAIKITTRETTAYEGLAHALLAQKRESNKARAIEIFGSLTYEEPNSESYRNL